MSLQNQRYDVIILLLHLQTLKFLLSLAGDIAIGAHKLTHEPANLMHEAGAERLPVIVSYLAKLLQPIKKEFICFLTNFFFYLLGGRSVKFTDFLKFCPKYVLPCLLMQFQYHILLSANHPNSDIFLECHLKKICGQHL